MDTQKMLESLEEWVKCITEKQRIPWYEQHSPPPPPAPYLVPGEHERVTSLPPQLSNMMITEVKLNKAVCPSLKSST